MKDQLIKILTHFNISATRFADEIGVQRSSISHILSGRNKPSYDFIVKVLEKYPSLDPLWLLTGKGEMITHGDASSAARGIEPVKTPDLFGESGKVPASSHKPEKNQQESKIDIGKQLRNITNVNNIESVILLFTNGTFVHYNKNE